MTILATLAAALLLLTVILFTYTVRSLRRRRPLRASLAALSVLATAAALAGFALLLLGYLSYQRLTAEQRVARIVFSRVADAEFSARLMVPGEQDQVFLLNGDEWQLDARLLTWTPPATILGLDPLYRLERLSGRYANIAAERELPRTVHSLMKESPVDLWSAARRYPKLTPGIDAYYGSATYLPMADGAAFDVSISRDALIARPGNAAARDAVGGWR